MGNRFGAYYNDGIKKIRWVASKKYRKAKVRLVTNRTYGISPRNKIYFTPEMDAQIIDLYVNRSMYVPEIEKIMGMSNTPIRRRLKFLGVPLKNSGYWRGKKQKPETVAKRVKTLTGMKKRPMTMEQRLAMSKRTTEYLQHHYLSKYGKHYSPKLDREMLYRSTYERTYMEMLDADPNVAWYEYEPKNISISYEYGGMSRLYKPDFFILYTNGEKRLVEVKSTYTVKWERAKAKIDALTKYGKDNPEIKCEVVVGKGNTMKVVEVLRLN